MAGLARYEGRSGTPTRSRFRVWFVVATMAYRQTQTRQHHLDYFRLHLQKNHLPQSNMGIPGLLPEILGSAGRPIDLRVFAPGVAHSSSSDEQLVPLRIGVDVSTWIHSASYGHNDRLNDERHLSNYGRAELLHDNKNQTDDSNERSATISAEMQQEYVLTCISHIIGRLQTLQHTSRAEMLVVLDGNMAPVKAAQVEARSRKRKQAEMERDQAVDQTGDEEALERRFRMSKRAGAGKYFTLILAGVIDQLRINQIPFLVAPYEADAQLAFLSLNRYIDLIVTEDSDLLAYGAGPILYKVIENISRGDPVGIIIRKEDLSAHNDSSNSSLHLTDFTPLMMVVMFVVVGSDYNIETKLKGIGIKAACNIVRDAFFGAPKGKETPNILEQIFIKAFSACWDRATLTEDYKDSYRKALIEALLMFRHPVVFDPIRAECVTMGCSDGDFELMSYAPYAELYADWDRREKIVGACMEKKVAICVAEGWISPRTLRPYVGTEAKLPDYVSEVLEGLDDDDESIHSTISV
jgi:5'-3' exonuclease